MSIREPGKRASNETVKAEQPQRLLIPPGTISHPRLKIAIEFMNANLQRKISLTELAKAAGLSPSHLSRLFKTQAGLSPCEYLIRLRMEKARYLLATTLLSIKEIMARAGYNNRGHFVQHFKRYYYGLSPSGYRTSVSTS